MSARAQPTPHFSPELDLEAAFPAASRADWLALVERGLKGQGFDATLVTRTLDGIAVAPLFADGDAPAAADCEAALSGDRPRRGWLIGQTYAHPDPAEARRQILADLARGVEGIGLRLDRATRLGLRPGDPGWVEQAGVDGILLGGEDALEALLEGVQLEMVQLSFQAGEAAEGVWLALQRIAARRGLDASQLRVALDDDPLGRLAEAGRARRADDGGLVAPTPALRDLPAARRSALRSVGVSTLAYHAAGASPVQELAFAMATAAAYLRQMAAQGWEAAMACEQIRFGFAVDADFFGSVAKLRAARRLWCRLQRALDGNTEQAGPMLLAASSSPRSLAAVDPWVNPIRASQQAVAAIVGGADQLSLLPYDAALGPSDEPALRLAVNTQSILMLEAGLDRLADPAGGSHYLEWLTDRLAREAWRRFREIEQAGGMLAALREGRVQAAVAEMAAARRAAVAEGRQTVVGVSKYPPPADQPPAGHPAP
ncbi:MAG: methylmalonyl-CoA mutase, partial [Chloroflexi bacterium]|nr:methylmalonyl-CoA mutase [Chloroflexota bacterium]